MTSDQIALELVKTYIEKANPNAMIAGLSLNAAGEQGAKLAGQNIGILFDIVYKAVEKTRSE